MEFRIDDVVSTTIKSLRGDIVVTGRVIEIDSSMLTLDNGYKYHSDACVLVDNVKFKDIIVKPFKSVQKCETYTHLIVWDNKYSNFLKHMDFKIDSYGCINVECNGDIRYNNNLEYGRFKLYRSSGIFDITDTPIFVHSSIFSFNVHTTKDIIIPLLGYMIFDIKTQSVLIEILKDDGNDDGHILGQKRINYGLYNDSISDIVVIDTVQENKLKLIIE